jgi:hypothetical protein
MSKPKTAIIFASSMCLLLLGTDFLVLGVSKLVDLGQDIAFCALGLILGVAINDMKTQNKKVDFLNADRLNYEVLKDENKQLEAKVQTLEAALKRAIN